jgi:hypothetical protein
MLTVTKIAQKNGLTGRVLLKLRFPWRKVEENSDCKYTNLPSDNEQAKTPNLTQSKVSSTDVSDPELESEKNLIPKHARTWSVDSSATDGSDLDLEKKPRRVEIV